jgi:alpha-methylacyl-CoA racemase
VVASRPTPSAPLSGVQVVEIGGALPIWYAGALLAALGASVVRVVPDRPLPILEVDRPSYQVLNGQKAELRADLRDETERAPVLDALTEADVALVGLRPATAAAWGLGQSDLARRAPKLIVAGLTAFGAEGPDVGVAGHDINATARSGLLALETQGDAPPAGTPYQTPIADLTASLFCVIGVLASLQGGAGAQGSFDVGMLHASLALLAAWTPAALVNASTAPFDSPWYALYQASDGEWVAVGALEKWQQEWLASQSSETDVSRIIASRTAAEWVADARRAGVAVSHLRRPAEVLGDEQIVDRLSRTADPADLWKRILLPVDFGLEARPPILGAEQLRDALDGFGGD